MRRRRWLPVLALLAAVGVAAWTLRPRSPGAPKREAPGARASHVEPSRGGLLDGIDGRPGPSSPPLSGREAGAPPPSGPEVATGWLELSGRLAGGWAFPATVRLALKKAALFWSPWEITENKVVHHEKAHYPPLKYMPGFPYLFALFLGGILLMLKDRLLRLDHWNAITSSSKEQSVSTGDMQIRSPARKPASM